MLDFDLMLMHCGEFGLYQKILFVFEAPFAVFVTFVLFGQLFMVLYPMNYWCEEHFACLDPESNISAAVRRNISFAWKDGWLFQNDPCEVNNVDDNFWNNFTRWHNNDKMECERNSNSSRPCQYNATSGRTIPHRGAIQSQGTLPDYDTGETRQQRHIGSYVARAGWVTTRPFRRGPSSTESEYFGGPDWPGKGEGTDNWYEGNGGNPWENTPAPSTTPPSKPATTTTTKRPFGVQPSPVPQTGSSPAPGRGGLAKRRRGGGVPTPVNSAFAGWPQPECPKGKNNLMRFSLGMNTRMIVESLRFPNKSYGRIEHCTVRWNRSGVPYETIVTEGDWWCNAEMYTTIAQAVFFLGAIVGGFLIGWIADTFGRVPALVIANILGALGGALSAVSPNFYAFSAFRFITGMAFDNCFTMMYILVLEFCGPSYRTLVANLSIAVFYTLGTIALPLIAWLISDWRIFALVISLPMLLGLLALFFVPESARWLLSKGRAKEATQILRNFAKVNRKKVDEQVFINFEQEATRLFSQMEMEEEEPSLGSAFRTPRLRRTFILLIVFWALIALVYDGHSRNIMNLANEELNVFWLFGIASMTEFPADMLLIFTLDRFGRRWLAFGAMVLSGAFSFMSAAVTPDMRIGFLLTAIISRFWVNVAFNIGLQYAAELLPTVIRAQGVNAIHIMGYVASIISPFVAAIGRSRPSLSLFILGICSIAAGIIALFLAETLGEELPNTLEEAEEFGRNQSFWNCPICAPREREDEYPISPPPAMEAPVVTRNALRASIRGETYRSSMISNAPSVGSRRSQLFGPGLGGGGKGKEKPTELTKLRRVTTH